MCCTQTWTRGRLALDSLMRALVCDPAGAAVSAAIATHKAGYA
jgi:hypothetical protein